MDAMALTWFLIRGLAQNFWYLLSVSSELIDFIKPKLVAHRGSSIVNSFWREVGYTPASLWWLGHHSGLSRSLLNHMNGECCLKQLGYQADESF